MIPLVDNGRIESSRRRRPCCAFCDSVALLSQQGVEIVFEIRPAAGPLAKFIANFRANFRHQLRDRQQRGSAILREEISLWPRILNVHVKDRLLGGAAVPLGAGAAELAKAIRLIEQSGYRGQYILQTARAVDGDHAGVLARYWDMTVRWIEDARQ